MIKSLFAAICILGMASPAFACDKDALSIKDAADLYGKQGATPIGEITDKSRFPDVDTDSVGIPNVTAWIIMVVPKQNVVIAIPTDGVCVATHGVVITKNVGQTT